MNNIYATNAVVIFLKMVEAVRRGITMEPRSANDKEYFAQDWFADRLRDAGLTFIQQGRNSYPDFLVTEPLPIEGYEIKSLAFTGERPARRDIDFNSTIPSGRKDNRNIFLTFFLYDGTGAGSRYVHTISLAHADLINADNAVADKHINIAIHNFGSYGDGFIRNRKMYVFPHPISIDPTGLGRQRLIVPSEWQLTHIELRKIATIERMVAQEAIDSYTIQLHKQSEADIKKIPNENAGNILSFDVFEVDLPE